MATLNSSASGATVPKRVRFHGSRYIEYDANQAPVVRLGGAARRVHPVAKAESNSSAPVVVDSELLASLQCECAARGLPVASTGDAAALQHALLREYAKELRSALQARGFVVSRSVDALASAIEDGSTNDGDSSDDVAALQRQLEIAELLQVQVALQAGGVQSSANALLDGCDSLALPEQSLPRLQLAKKELEGHVDDGYVFGRRFCSVAAFINTLEFDELVALAQNRALTVPDLSDAEKKAIPVVERELCARHSATGMGKPLKQLTLRELTVEAHARELIVVHARDRDGKRSKKGLIEKLRPVLRQEVLDEKILDKRDDLLRALLLDVLEHEAAQFQARALVQLIEQHLARLGPQPTASPESATECTLAMGVDESSSNGSNSSVTPNTTTVAPAAANSADDAVRAQLQRSYRLLLERLESQVPR